MTERRLGAEAWSAKAAWSVRASSSVADRGPRTKVLGCELFVVFPDGREEIEHFDDTVELNRQMKLETRLTSAGWFGPHGCVI